ncbi:MAG TPA: glycosyltransferase, partial [Stellaceae bacterium]|nr:glycosyltransferase [Stellaceae bacterium]
QIALLDASNEPLVADWAEKYAPLIAYRYHRKHDEGQAAAIQEGWDHTRGTFVGWLNADDYLLPGALARVKSVFEADPTIDVVYGHATYVDKEGAFERYFPAITSQIGTLLCGNPICQPACFMRRQAMERVGGLDRTLHYTMDWDLWLRLYRAGCRFFMLDEPLAVVCDRRDAKTNTGGKRRMREIRACLRYNPSAVSRMKTMTDFRAYDYIHNKKGVISFLVKMIARYRWSRRAALPPLFGLARRDNRFEDRCRITLAWFGPSDATRATLITDRPGAYYLEDERGSRPFTFLDFHGGGVRSGAEILARPGSRVDYTIGTRSGPCRLLGFKIA